MQCLETPPTLAHVNSLAQWRHSVAQAYSAGGTAPLPAVHGPGHCDGLHHPHPLFAGVHKDLVHIAKLYPVHTQVTALHSKLGVMGLVREKKARSLVDGPPHVAQANLNHMERGAWGTFCKH